MGDWTVPTHRFRNSDRFQRQIDGIASGIVRTESQSVVSRGSGHSYDSQGG